MLAVSDRLIEAAFFILLGIFFDFFDGLVARRLKVQSELGVQLDSLADMVTSGVAPGIIMLQLIRRSIGHWSEGGILSQSYVNTNELITWGNFKLSFIDVLPFLGLLLTLSAAYRLAKFNIDTRQTTSFIGLPTPAMALYVVSLPLIIVYGQQDLAIDLINNKYFLLTSTIVLAILMNIELPMFSLKLKNFSFNKNLTEVVFLIISVILLITLKFVAIPLIILLYILISAFKNFK